MLGCTEPLISGTGLWILIAFVAGFVSAWSSKKHKARRGMEEERKMKCGVSGCNKEAVKTLGTHIGGVSFLCEEHFKLLGTGKTKFVKKNKAE